MNFLKKIAELLAMIAVSFVMVQGAARHPAESKANESIHNTRRFETTCSL